AGGVVGAHQVVVDGFGHADKPDVAVFGGAVGGQFGDGVHAVVAADVQHRPDLVPVKQLEQRLVGRFVHLGVGQLVAAAAKKAGGGALEQFDGHFVAQLPVQIHDPPFQQPFDAVLHPVHMLSAKSLGALIHAGQAGVDHGGGPAGLSYKKIPSHNRT